MALLNLLSCLALGFLPHIVYYHATPLAEFGVLKSVLSGFFLQLLTSSAKVVLLACLLPGTELTKQDVWKDLAQLLVALTDILGLYFALTVKWAHKSIANEHRFQAVGIGWAFGDSILRRFFPMWFSGLSPEFSMANIFEAFRSNIILIHSLSFSAIGTLVFNKRIQQGALATFLKVALLLLTILPFATNLFEESRNLSEFQSLTLEFVLSVFSALISWELWSNATKKQS